MARRLAPVVVLAALAIAGCTAPVAERADAPATQAQTIDTAPQNLFLLDAPRPFGSFVSNGAEPIVHVMRDNSAILVADWTGLSRSTDGGATWTRSPNPFVEAVLADGWSLAEDAAGTLYAADTNGPFVGVAASRDGGRTWAVQSKLVEAGPIVDRPWLAARGDGEVALITNVVGRPNSLSNVGQVEACSRSLDGGNTFLDRTLLAGGQPNAGNLVFTSTGELWYSDGADFWRWAAGCQAAPRRVDHPNGGSQIFAQVGIDAQDRLYVAIPSADNRQMLVHGRAADGSYKTVAVSAPALRSNTFGAIHVDLATGEVAVGWYGSEAAGDPAVPTFTGAWNVFVTRVNGFWSATPTMTTARLTTEPNHIGGFCMGGTSCATGGGDRDLLDYFGVQHGPDGKVHVAYGHDGAGSNEQVRYARVE